MSLHGHGTFAIVRLWKKCMHNGFTKCFASFEQLTPKSSFLLEWKLTPNISNVGSQHFQQNPSFTLNHGNVQLLLECFPKHLKHILKIEGHPRPSWCTNDFVITVHKSHEAAPDIRFNLRSIVLSLYLNSWKSSVSQLTDESFTISFPSIIFDIARYLSSSEQRLKMMSVKPITYL